MARILPDFSELQNRDPLSSWYFGVPRTVADTKTDLVFTFPRQALMPYPAGNFDYAKMEFRIAQNKDAFPTAHVGAVGTIPEASGGYAYVPSGAGGLGALVDGTAVETVRAVTSAWSADTTASTRRHKLLRGDGSYLTALGSPYDLVEVRFPQTIRAEKAQYAVPALSVSTQCPGTFMYGLEPSVGVGDEVSFVDCPLVDYADVAMQFGNKDGANGATDACQGWVKRSALSKTIAAMVPADIAVGWLVQGATAQFCINGAVVRTVSMGTYSSFGLNFSASFTAGMLTETTPVFTQIQFVWESYDGNYPLNDVKDLAGIIHVQADAGGSKYVDDTTLTTFSPYSSGTLPVDMTSTVFVTRFTTDHAAAPFVEWQGWNDFQVKEMTNVVMAYYPSPFTPAFWTQRVKAEEVI